jgi:tRNA-specific 2-thiouridylase
MARAVALFSGGLDSTLAILTVIKQGVEVNALKFQTPFDCDTSHTNLHSYVSHSPTPPIKGWEHTPTPCLTDGRRVLLRGDLPSSLVGEVYQPLAAPKATRGKGEGYHIFLNADKFGFKVKLIDLSDRFIEIVKNPKFGYGKNMNPCLDCRILMLKEAKAFMNMIGADFIVTGEVLGQRPMSQRRDVLNLVDREAGVIDYVLRPLSAKLLKVTIPDAEGIVDREMLYGFSGRSRKSQIGLAKDFGLTDYPAPAGGCLLTEPNYAHRLKDLLVHNSAPDIRDINLLRIGRHFRFSPFCKIIVGRDKAENEAISFLSVNDDCLLKVEGYGSPTTLVKGVITDKAISVAASICARYSDAKKLSEVVVTAIKEDSIFRLRVSPAGNEITEALRIELKLPITKIQ